MKKGDDQKVSELTVGELKEIIKESIYDLIDPDHGLQLKPDVEKELIKSLASKSRTPVENVMEELGFKW